MLAAPSRMHKVTGLLSVPSAYSSWLTRGQHATQPWYTWARQ